jgi:hypothetical protein
VKGLNVFERSEVPLELKILSWHSTYSPIQKNAYVNIRDLGD